MQVIGGTKPARGNDRRNERSMPTDLGGRIREWRRFRGISQLELAFRANSSQRHVSFLESGRSKPSRNLLLALTQALDMPLRARNEILVTAGFAPFFPGRPLQSTELSQTRLLLARMLAHHEPYPAIVLDLGWNILMSNRPAARLLRLCVPERSPDRSLEGLNLMRLMCDPGGMRPYIASWNHTGPVLLARLRREASANPGSPADRLLRELIEENAFPPPDEPAEPPLEPTIPVELKLGDQRLKLVNTLTTFGTPQDVTIQELRIDMSFPADEASDRILHAWAEETRRRGV
jgi:transcriptional regulator with XRE-family HTH domain